MHGRLRLIGRLSSINVQKVAWCLGELGLAFTREEAGGAFGVVDTPPYLAMNPNGLVPTLVEGDFVLWESNAIVRYLAAKHPEAGLWPEEPQVRADADRWMDWQATNATPALRDAFWQIVRTRPEERDEAALRRSVESSAAKAEILDRALSGRLYVAGDTFTMGDIPVGCHVHRWLKLPIDRPELPNLLGWYGRLRSRPASRAVFDLPLT